MFITTYSARSCNNNANVAANTEIRKMRRRLSSTERPESTHLLQLHNLYGLVKTWSFWRVYIKTVMQVQAHSHMTSLSGRTGLGR